MMKSIFFATVLLLFAVAALGEAIDNDTRVIINYGDRAPDLAEFGNTYSPSVNNAGQFAFASWVDDLFSGSGLGQRGIFHHDPVLGETRVMRTSQNLPDGSAFRSLPYTPQIDQAGRVHFLASTTVSPTSSTFDLFMTDPGGTNVRPVARVGETLPVGSSMYSRIISLDVGDNGHAGFWADIQLSGGTASRGVFVADPTGTVSQLAILGQSAPDGNGSFSSLGTPRVNASGQVLITAYMQSTTNGSLDARGLYVSQPGQITPTQIIRGGEPDFGREANGNFFAMNNARMNNSGKIVFEADFSGTAGGTSDDEGLYLTDLNSLHTKIIREGDSAPGNGVFVRGTHPRINNNAQVVFTGVLGNTLWGSSDDTGIYLGGNVSGGVQQVARERQAAPGGGLFSDFQRNALEVEINDAGQVLFMSETSQNSAPGLFFYDPDAGLMKVAVPGDTIEGHTILSISYAPDSVSLTDNGEVYFDFFAQGAGGIARWSFADAVLLPGDLNDDGVVTNADIPAFVQALTDPSGFATAFPDVDPDLAGDFNDDGVFTNADIAGFVDLLTASPSLASSADFAELASLAVPEPSSLALLGLGGLALMHRRR